MAAKRERWHQVRARFEELVELPAPERAAALAALAADDPELAREVDALLGWHVEADRFLDEPPGLPASLSTDRIAEMGDEPPLTLPESLGPYRILGPLGQGGMGTVYRAERGDDAYRKPVAIKILEGPYRRPELVSRFRTERQILAQLDHPNIATLLDGGTTPAGQPYLVMELIEGIPIDRYCDDRRLPVEARLRLMIKVAGAVQYAHRHLVVHRDLKPANILVTEDGEPKLLDFGIAKILEPSALSLTVLATELGVAPLTPEYASPEQITGRPITAGSDVYSLGVLLYELATGRSPYRSSVRGAGLERLAQAIVREEPERPSLTVLRPLEPGARGVEPKEAAERRSTEPRQLSRRLAGDLDTVLAKALTKEPERRYGSAEQFAADLEAHLDGRPVHARPDTFFYRSGKFLHRHAWASTATAAVFLVLATLVAVLWVQRLQLLRQTHRAEAVSTFLTNVFGNPDPAQSRGAALTARELLDRGAQKIESELGREPEVLGDLLLTIGRSYKGLGLYAQATAALERALAERLRSEDPESPAVAEVLQDLAEAQTFAGDFSGAEAHLRQAVAIRRRHPPMAKPAVESLVQLARALELKGERKEAGALFAEALAAARRLGDRATIAGVLHRTAIFDRQDRRPEISEQRFREALALRRATLGADHPDVAVTENDFGLFLLEQGRFAEAETQLRQAETIERRLYGQSHPDLATTLNNQALLRERQGRAQEAEALFRRALDMLATTTAAGHPLHATVGQNLGDLLLAEGRPDEAETLYRQALDLRRRALPPGHPDTAATLNNLAHLVGGRGRSREANDLLQEALRTSRAALGPRHAQVATILNNLGQLEQRQGHLAPARNFYRQGLDIARTNPATAPLDLAVALNNLGALEVEIGEIASAKARFQEALALLESTFGKDHLNVAMVRLSLAEAELKSGSPKAATPLAERALAVLEKNLAATDPWVRAGHRTLGTSLLREGRYPAAESHLMLLVRKTSIGSKPWPRDLDLLAELYSAWGRPVEAARYRSARGSGES
ncbi:MAG TPA: serine/threonine-protein kinase [Thermoanaerobaculia bacterium]|jgi:serine/threonine-protein kinase|nr:serine/threonine-protein kinase [Thermoanaerobaculia bacterium]